MEQYQTITKVAQSLDVSVDTIRRWNKKGLLKAKRDANNRRLFNVSEVEALQIKLHGGKESQQMPFLDNKKIIEKATCIDLFAGAGGTALGFSRAGFNHVLLNELDENAVKTLQNNSKKHALGWHILPKDIHQVDFSNYSAEVIQAGFPCQAFSYAGKSMGFEDTRGTLFFEFARAIKEVRPKIAIGENVRGLLRHDGGKTLATMLNTLEELGYDCCYRVLRAQYHDVPQKRERLILFAIRKDLDLPFVFPKEKDYYFSLKEALEHVPDSPGEKYSEKKYSVLTLVPEGGYWKDLPEEVAKEYMGKSYYLGGGRTGMARRLSWDEPSLTLTCSPSQKQTERCHPSETRPLTIREYARIQTFPDNWTFSGSVAQQYKQIGNAVPVNLAFHIGEAVLAALGYLPLTSDFEVIERTVQAKSA